MELQFPSPPLLLAFLLFIFMVLKILINTTKPNSSTSKLPPGPWQLPLIGNIHQLAVSSSLPHHTLTNLATKHGPLMHLLLGEVSTIVVSSPEIAEQVMKTHDLVFAQRPYLLASRIVSYGSTNIGFSPYGEYWRQLRKICTTELLSSKRVETFRGIREEEVMNFVRDISSNTGSAINLSKRIYSHTYGVTARAAFGKKNRDQEEFMEAMDEVVALYGGFSVADMYPSVKLLQVMSGMRRKLEKLHKRVDQILENIVNEHREQKTQRESGRGEAEDLVDVLLRVQKDGELEFPLTGDNVKAVILDIFSAGSETSSGVIEWAMSEMLKNPEMMKRAQAEEKATSNARLMDTKYLPRPKSLSMRGRLVEIPDTGMKQRNLIQRDFSTAQLISRGHVSNIYHLEQEEGYVRALHLLFLIFSFHLRNCCTISIGNSSLE